MRILFVCIGNICRSPIAEGVLRHWAEYHQLSWEIDSCGVAGYHIGEQPHRFSQKVCLQHGINILGQRARKIKQRDFAEYDRIYAMATDVLDELQKMVSSREHLSKLSLFMDELEPGAGLSVPDPWYGDEDGYLPVYQMIEKGCLAIIERYGKK